MRYFHCLSHHVISIHAPTRGATLLPSAGIHSSENFNPRSHKGSDNKNREEIRLARISIHAPTRGATARAMTIIRSHIFQSTLPQGERRCCSSSNKDSTFISIHAPTRGATNRTKIPLHKHSISIHAPTRGATFSLYIALSYSAYFNPRSHKGSDGNRHDSEKCSEKFQSTLPQGERRFYDALAVCKIEFQSTLPQGERHKNDSVVEGHGNFNPRSHKGSDSNFPQF